MGSMPSRDDARLRQALAELGVGLFRSAPSVRPPSAREFETLVAALVRSEDPRLVASLPCLFVLHAGVAEEGVRRAAEQLDGAGRELLGLAWRLARAFAVQWEPDIVHLFGRAVRLPPLPIEPSELPEPEADDGERCPAVARELHDRDPGGNVVIDFIDAFRTWLRQTELERPAAARA